MVMILTEFLVVGGVLYIGVSAYHKQRKKQKLAQFLQLQKRTAAGRNIIPSSDEAKAVSQPFTQDKTLPGVGKKRCQQFKTKRREAEKEASRLLTISLISLGFATAGVLLYAPLVILSLPGALYATMPLHKSTFKAFKEGKVKVDTLATLTVVGCLVNGYMWFWV